MIQPRLVPHLKELLSPRRPFGPTSTEKIDNKEIAELLFDRENKLYRALDDSPSLVMGRRGSGKTAYLGASYFDQSKNIIFEIKQQELFSRVFEAVEKIVQRVPLAESISDIWRTILTTAALQKLTAQYKTLPHTKDFLAKIGCRSGESLEDVLWNLVDGLADRTKDTAPGQIAFAIKTFDNVTLNDAIRESTDALNADGRKVIILLDSLEQYPFSIPLVTHAIRGLLKCVGDYNCHDIPFQLKFCLPAELYHTFLDISSNPHKDFDNSVTLHWHPSELLFIAARRIMIYLEVHEKERWEDLCGLNPDSKDGAQKIFFSVFPETIVNGLKFEENTIGYLFRHTQLLPRQFLRILNKIAATSKRMGQENLKISSKAIVTGVAEIEGESVMEICSGFRSRYPQAYVSCEAVIKELPFCFGHGELHRAFNHFGKKYFHSSDFDEFKRMMIEIGAIGRVLGKTGRYVEGIFEYTEPHKLVVGVNDELCFHPIFAGAFGSTSCRTGKCDFTVYPYGADMNLADWRDI